MMNNNLYRLLLVMMTVTVIITVFVSVKSKIGFNFFNENIQNVVYKKADYEQILNTNRSNKSVGDSTTNKSVGDSTTNKSVGDSTTNKILINMARAIHKALIHSKSLKARKALKVAKGEITTLLETSGLKYDNVTARSERQPKNVCPEEFKGTLYGFHLWNTGFVETNCSYRKELKDLITVIVFADRDSNVLLPTVYQNVKVIVSKSKDYTTMKIKSQSTKVLKHDSSKTAAETWNNLLEYVTTEYVLIARDIYEFDEHMRIERLIRAIETLGVSAAAGAVRYRNGHWRVGCRQRALRNYTLVYQEGYDESFKECVFCDHVDGPFVIQTKKAKSLAFDMSIINEGLFEDFFIRLKDEQSVVCPDAMFHVNRNERRTSWKEWNDFFKKWNLYKIKFGEKDDIVFPCNTKTVCSKPNSLLLTPCCLQILSKVIAFISTLCIKNNIICEVDAGTLMGAVKLSKVLPWDIDADFIFTSSQYKILQTLGTKVRDAGYSFEMAQRPKPNKKFNNTLDSGEFDVRSNGWMIELFGRWILNSADFIKLGKNQTKTNINGVGVVSPSNPGLYARNRYGEEIYKHTPHWRHSGYKHSYIPYKKVGSFGKCVKPGHHTCLDQFNGDGNLQFNDPIP